MGWRLLLGGMLIWALHFFGLYGIGSIWHSSMTARLPAAVLTVLCLAGEGRLIMRLSRRGGDDLDGWMRKLALAFVVLASVAIIWQGLPALLA